MPHLKTILLLIGMLFCICAPAHAKALSVDDVRFGVHPEKIRMVLDLSQVSDYRVFTMDKPYRLIVDLTSFEWRAGKVARPAQSGIRDIREGPLQPGISRIVFDMDRPISVNTAFLIPRQGRTPDRLVIDYSPVSAQTFRANKERIHGTLRATDIDPDQSLAAANPPRDHESAPPLPKAKPEKKPEKNTNKSGGKKKIVVIDPGHGGVDPGAVGVDNIYEKHVVLALAKSLKAQLEETGRYRVLMTRDKDVFVKLSNRVKFARDNNADLFVSIHADTIHKPNVSGTSVYTLSKEASDAQTAQLAEKENKADLIAGIDLSVEDEQVVNILFDFARTETMNESKFFANTLVRNMKEDGVKLLENPSRHAGFAVLKAPDVPSILIEAGFMSNKKEARLLNKPEHREKIARSIRKGIDLFFEHVQHYENN